MPEALAGDLLIRLLPLLVATGLVAGLLAGLLGVGGGIVIVPVLYHVFGLLAIDPEVRMHVAVGTSLATIIPTSLRSIRAHAHRGSFDRGLFREWAPALLLGALLGTWLATLADFRSLTALFGIVALLVAVHMGLGREHVRIANALPGRAGSSALATVIGAVSAMMGIGGGTLSVPTLTLFGVPVHRAVGTAAGFGLLISLPATVGFAWGGFGLPGLPPASLGYVNLAGVAVITPATLLMVPLGARLAHSLGQVGLRRAFAFFLGVTAVRMLSDAFGA